MEVFNLALLVAYLGGYDTNSKFLSNGMIFSYIENNEMVQNISQLRYTKAVLVVLPIHVPKT